MQPFRFAILGAAKIGANFCDAARRAEGVTVAAVASKSMERARAFAEANGVEHYYADYAEMLDREKPDCAYVDVTPHDHFRLSMLCLEKGVPVQDEIRLHGHALRLGSAASVAVRVLPDDRTGGAMGISH